METVESVRDFVAANKSNPAIGEKSIKNITSLSGGFVNYVYRVEFEDESSVIVKYYPRFFSSDKAIEMSQTRYFIEKNALTLLNDQPWVKSNPNSLIRTPKVLLADDEKYTMVMEDAGSKSRTLLEHFQNDEKLIKDDAMIAQIAKDICQFSEYLSDESGITWETHGELFENRAVQVVTTYFCHFCVEQAKRLNLEKELEPYLKCVNKVFRPFGDESNRDSLKRVFIFGDLWPNSILVDQERNYLWIIDWEMARFETRYRDIQQLMANLWMMKQNEKIFNQKSIEKLMKRLQFEFFGDENNDWRLNSWKYGRELFVLLITTNFRDKHLQLDHKNVVIKAIKEVYLV